MSVDGALDDSRFRFVDVGGVSTRYFESGVGEPLVLLHGGHPGFIDSLETWALNLNALAENFHVFALDKIGQGHTAAPADDDSYTQEYTLRHTLEWMSAIGIGEAHLAGHSRGGLLAAQIAFELGAAALSTVLVNSATLAPDPDDSGLRAEVFYAGLSTRGHTGPWTAAQVRVEPEANSYRHRHITDAYVDRRLAISRLPQFQVAEQRMRGGLLETVFMPDLTRQRAATLDRIDRDGLPCPTLVVWGANDRSAPLREVGLHLYERVSRTTEITEMHMFNHAGHYSYREHPAAFNAVVTQFCSRDN